MSTGKANFPEKANPSAYISYNEEEGRWGVRKSVRKRILLLATENTITTPSILLAANQRDKSREILEA